MEISRPRDQESQYAFDATSDYHLDIAFICTKGKLNLYHFIVLIYTCMQLQNMYHSRPRLALDVTFPLTLVIPDRELYCPFMYLVVPHSNIDYH